MILLSISLLHVFRSILLQPCISRISSTQCVSSRRLVCSCVCVFLTFVVFFVFVFFSWKFRQAVGVGHFGCAPNPAAELKSSALQRLGDCCSALHRLSRPSGLINQPVMHGEEVPCDDRPCARPVVAPVAPAAVAPSAGALRIVFAACGGVPLSHRP